MDTFNKETPKEEEFLNKPISKYNLGDIIKATKYITNSFNSFIKDDKKKAVIRDILDYIRPRHH